MRIDYCLYNATGNTFILLDNRNQSLDILKSSSVIRRLLCRPDEGPSVDGLILLEQSLRASIKMLYYNADGLEASLCANGVRSTAHFFYHRIKKVSSLSVETPRSLLQTKITGKPGNFQVSLNLGDISQVDTLDISPLFPMASRSLYVEAGVPHCVFLVEKIEDTFLKDRAQKIRHHKIFPQGANVNFLEIISLEEKSFKVRTFERGVEAETLSCGTGTISSALALSHWFSLQGPLQFHTAGGPLEVVLRAGENPSLKGGVFQEKQANGELIVGENTVEWRLCTEDSSSPLSSSSPRQPMEESSSE